MRPLTKIRSMTAFQIPKETLFPFLYQTRTISNQSDAPSPTPTPQPDSNEEKTLTFLQRKAREVQLGKASKSSLTSSEREIFMNIQKNFGAKLDGIALPPQPPPSEPEEPRISRLSKPKSPRSQIPELEPAFVHATNRNINHILSFFAPAESTESAKQFTTFTSQSAQRNDNEQLSETASPPPPTSPQDIRRAALQSLQHISTALQTALTSTTTPPDHTLWHTLTTEVFPLITLLTLQRTSPTQNPYQNTLSSIPPTSLPACLTTLPPSTPLLPLITILYPSATLLALHTYISALPTSGFTLALLPKIRSLGPASYLLAGNTHFFNALLYLHWTVYSDLRAMQEVLAEMKRTGVEYDLGTVELIEEVRRARDEDIRTGGGRGASWWAGRNQVEGWGKLMWRYKFDVLDERREKMVGKEGDEGSAGKEGEEDLEIR